MTGWSARAFRTRLARDVSLGAIAIDDSQASPVEQVLALTDGEGADKGCECVGYQAHDPEGHEQGGPDESDPQAGSDSVR